jgi:hypothetical protein
LAGGRRLLRNQAAGREMIAAGLYNGRDILFQKDPSSAF